MESTKDALRLRLILGKYQVTKIEKGLMGLRATIALPQSVTMTADLPASADVRLGDWLTFYSEVPYLTPGEAA